MIPEYVYLEPQSSLHIFLVILRQIIVTFSLILLLKDTKVFPNSSQAQPSPNKSPYLPPAQGNHRSGGFGK